MIAAAAIPRHDMVAFGFLHQAGQLAASALDMITPHVKAGVTTGHLDGLLHQYILANHATPAPLGYRGYPKATCISVNHVVCHGIPSDKPLQDSDIVNIDVTVILNGWYGDTSRMYMVGTPPIKAQRLVQNTYEALMLGVAQVRPGVTLGCVAHAIQTHAEKAGFGVVRDFCGHGIGRVFHCDPQVLHYGQPNIGVVLDVGMVFTIEPMINAGTWQVKILSDGWTAVTRDRQLSAQFEHTLGVTESGCQIFTSSPAGYHCPPYSAK